MMNFARASLMGEQSRIDPCRGCAAKVSSKPLKAALDAAELSELDSYPQDAALVKSSLDTLSFAKPV